jgi:hypothetical protein
MINRMVGAAQLNSNVYEEVEHNTDLTSEALRVVALVSLLAGIGSGLTTLFIGKPGAFIGTLIVGVVGALIAWAVWSYATYLVGTKLFGGSATYGELLRTVGYAYTPNALGVFGFIPVLGGLLAFAGAIWALVAGVIAVRQALDFDTGKAIATVLVALIPAVIVILIISLPLGLIGAVAGA